MLASMEEKTTELPNLSIEDDAREDTKLTSASNAALFDSGTVVADFVARPYLMLVGGTTTRQVFALDQHEHVIGRASSCTPWTA